MTNDEIDKLARDLPRLTMHGPIPTATTYAFSGRIVELLVRLELLQQGDRVVRRAIARLADGLNVDERSSPQLTLTACDVEVGIIHRESDDLRGELRLSKARVAKLEAVIDRAGMAREHKVPDVR